MTEEAGVNELVEGITGSLEIDLVENALEIELRLKFARLKFALKGPALEKEILEGIRWI